MDGKVYVKTSPDGNPIRIHSERVKEGKNEFTRGLGLWKFNNTLLEDESYKDLIEFYYPQILNKYSEVTDKQLLWELLKMELRGKTNKFSKQKRFRS